MPSGHCTKCGTYRRALHTDHIVPRWKYRAGLVAGDMDAPDNLQLLCANCHQDKTEDDLRDPLFRSRPRARFTKSHHVVVVTEPAKTTHPDDIQDIKRRQFTNERWLSRHTR